MRFLPTPIPGVILVEPDVHRDARGFFLETYHAARYREGGIRETLRAGQPLAFGEATRCAACTPSRRIRRASWCA